MYAQCPECLTFFHLKPSHLKVANGRVRCSRCKHVFNALETLRDELNAEEVAEVEAARRREPKPDAPLLSEEYAGDLFDGLDYIRNEELPLEADHGVIPPMTHGAPEAPARLPRGIHDFGPVREPARHPILYGTGVALLLLVLAAQLIHWQRAYLLEHPVSGPHLARMYAALDVDMQPPPDLGALTVSRTEVSSHPGQPRALLLTAVLENTGDRAQSWPELRVDLQDRWGETIAARYFEAAEYLRDPAAATRPLDGHARFAISLAIMDPGSEAVGFRIEACFPTGGPNESRHACTDDVNNTP